MHASLPELLSLRDAEPIDARVAQHVSACAQCRRELDRLSDMRERLHRMPLLDAPPDAWVQISQRVQQAPAGGSRWRWMSAAAAAAMLIAIAGVLVTSERERSASVAPQSAITATPSEPVDDLVARSQELEELLLALPHRPLIERVSTAATIDTLEQRIQWLDYQLSYAPEGALNDAQSERLWRERVELMDSLVKVRYAEAGRLSF